MNKNELNIDKKAFEQIYREHHKKLWAFIIRHIKNKELAEDIVHDAFFNLWQKRAIYKIDENWNALLFTTVRNLLTNHYRRSILEEQAKETHFLLNPQESQIQSKDERIKKLEIAIESLPNRQCQIFKMSKQQGLTYTEIAEELSISKNTVEVQMVKARKYLQKKLSSFLFLFL